MPCLRGMAVRVMDDETVLIVPVVIFRRAPQWFNLIQLAVFGSGTVGVLVGVLLGTGV